MADAFLSVQCFALEAIKYVTQDVDEFSKFDLLVAQKELHHLLTDNDDLVRWIVTNFNNKSNDNDDVDGGNDVDYCHVFDTKQFRAFIDFALDDIRNCVNDAPHEMDFCGDIHDALVKFLNHRKLADKEVVGGGVI
ncbi:asb050 [Agrotis segetum nucleopolyhedrovirus B]|uniref:Asb050 n=1 Tax=Agrotis segetum nucleopolyhedrovirus B TaxID=1580580 RepID=A0A0A7KR69_9ABAC|nr:asb050 [Agrotis segetum nucleopolyhedrovirus B]AIZ48608.1 asb050 [Agrotis segetum nucleopolyhedrovirus B]